LIASPIAPNPLDRAEQILSALRESPTALSGGGHGTDFAIKGAEDIRLLLQIAVGYPEATDRDLIAMLSARLLRIKEARGCGTCDADRGGPGQKPPKDITLI
jgi:hypothetical protein